MAMSLSVQGQPCENTSAVSNHQVALSRIIKPTGEKCSINQGQRVIVFTVLRTIDKYLFVHSLGPFGEVQESALRGRISSVYLIGS